MLQDSLPDLLAISIATSFLCHFLFLTPPLFRPIQNCIDVIFTHFFWLDFNDNNRLRKNELSYLSIYRQHVTWTEIWQYFNSRLDQAVTL